MHIDVHTHIWPDRIAPAVAENMVATFGYPAVGVNTVDGIKSHMRESGVDKSVVLGVVERPEQVERANDWLISIQDDMLVPFGAMHPDMDDAAGEVRRLREAGIRGIKVHPMVNQFYPDDPRMFPVYEEMGEDMVVEVHSGRWAHTQPGDTIWAEPSRIMNVVRQFPKLKVIALHLGRFLHAGRGGAGAHRQGQYPHRHHLAPGPERSGDRDADGHHQQARAGQSLLRHRLSSGRHGPRLPVHRKPARP